MGPGQEWNKVILYTFPTNVPNFDCLWGYFELFQTWVILTKFRSGMYVSKRQNFINRVKFVELEEELKAVK